MQYDSLKAKWPRYLMWVKLLKPKILIIYTVQFICNCPWTKYVQLFSHRPVDPAWIIEIIHKTKFRKSWDTKIKVRPTILIWWSGWMTDVPALMQNEWEVIWSDQKKSWITQELDGKLRGSDMVGLSECEEALTVKHARIFEAGINVPIGCKFLGCSSSWNRIWKVVGRYASFE